ncbi:substrate-binding domain-containing protein [uncultured Dysosmobacter sp.]|uniref:sugar ABC transporter substrate-binding protein n=1 Tax=uncultured Dysosmobacter sp. TaxID=2591384 RepID=UPI002606D213|nr:substrate-binding domain-containing protein [uncultured Dysosmobacter sp.]
MKFTKRLLACLMLVCMILSLVACSNQKQTESKLPEGGQTETQEPTGEAQRTFAIVYPIVHPFFEPIGADAEEYAKTNNCTIITKAPDSSNAQQQIEIMENLISMNVDGIAIGPTDTSALVPTINKAIEKGIKVICFESEAPDSDALAFIGTDNYKAGRHLGEVIGKNLNGEGKIVILTGLPTQFSLNERIRGIEEYLAEKYPNIQVVDTQPSEGDPQKAVTCTENMIQAHPDFDALIGIDATAGPAAASVWKAKGWQDDPDHLILTFDDMEDNLQGVRDGYIKAIVAQRQTTWAEQIIDTLNALCDGESVEAYNDTGSVEITINNIDTYVDEPSYVEK